MKSRVSNRGRGRDLCHAARRMKSFRSSVNHRSGSGAAGGSWRSRNYFNTALAVLSAHVCATAAGDSETTRWLGDAYRNTDEISSTDFASSRCSTLSAILSLSLSFSPLFLPSFLSLYSAALNVTFSRRRAANAWNFAESNISPFTDDPFLSTFARP